MDNEIPLGRRTALYRVFEMLPATISYTALALVLVLPFVSPQLAAWYVMAIVALMFFRAVRGAIDLLRGYRRLKGATSVDWSARLADIDRARRGLDAIAFSGTFQADRHQANLALVRENTGACPSPAGVHHAVIVAAYNESYDVIAPTIRSLVDTTTDKDRLLVFFAHEERGGEAMRRTARRLKAEFGRHFAAFELVEHPPGLPAEIAGKGANITYAGRYVKAWVSEARIDPASVLVTTLDCDNKPHPSYFDCVAYEFVMNPDRKHASFQPISLFLNNIWDAPAPTRVVASGNSFWNITSSVRPLALRNFASHTQPLDALIEMDFWSTRTIVEDGHQYWRSWFHFDGKYKVTPIRVPIYQDAVLAGSLKDTLVAQFRQLSRWSYGASDVPYVAVRTFGRGRSAPFWPSLWRFLSLLEGHVSLACVSLIIAVGGWLPLYLTMQQGVLDTVVARLPILVGTIQQVAALGLVVSIVLAWKMLPPRPERYTRSRSVGMLAQWLLFPVTIIAYNATTAICSQGRLLVGAYRERFDVTAKSAVPTEPTPTPSVLLDERAA